MKPYSGRLTEKMTATLIIVCFAIVALAYFLLSATWHLTRPATRSELLPIDMKSLAALIASDQTEYLRRSLDAKQFRFYEREQKLVIAEYVKRISHNSRVFIERVNGERSTDVSVEIQRLETLQLAMHTRRMCVSALPLLYVSAYVPWLGSPLEEVASIQRAANRFFPNFS
jgi:hypothetical protein